MLRLSESDYRSVLDVLREAGAINGPIPFPEPGSTHFAGSSPATSLPTTKCRIAPDSQDLST
jgi:hypothetical protein